MKKLNIQRGIMLLFITVSYVTIAWMPASNELSLFQSPITIQEVQILPTPRPPAVLSSSDVILGSPTLSTNLNGYWQLNETDTGNRFDSSPNGSNTLTNINGVTWTAGREGIASDFERDNSQHLKIESYEAVGLNFYHSFTLMGWLKRESLDEHMILASKYEYGLSERAYRLQLTPDNRLRLVVSPDGLTYSPDFYATGGTVLTSPTVWYHVAGVFDAGAKRIKLYVNGALDSDKSVTYDTVHQTPAAFMLGANLKNGQPVQHFDGQLDDWRAYNRALAQSEIQAAMGGLKAYWSLDETGSGPRADSSPFGNTLTNIGGVGAVPGQIGNAADFEADSTPLQYLTIDDGQQVGLDFSHSFTLVGWVKRESLGNYQILAAKYAFGDGINERAYRIDLIPDNRLRLIVSPDGAYTSAYVVSSNNSLDSTTDWYHVAGVFDAGAKLLKLYVNGTLEGSRSVTYDTVYASAAPFTLGANLWDGVAAQPFDGLLDEWRAYDRVLSQNEIQALLNQ